MVNVYMPTSLADALRIRDLHETLVINGGTDVMVELQRGIKPTATLIDISRLRELKYVRLDGDIGLISGGAGMTMAAMDMMWSKSGLRNGDRVWIY